MRTYVRARSGDQGGGAPARRRRSERLRGRATARDRPHDRARLAPAALLLGSAWADPTCPRCWRSSSARSSSPMRATPSCSASIWATATSAVSRELPELCASSLDARYPRHRGRHRSAIPSLFPNNRVRAGRASTEAASRGPDLYSGHLACLFPQHGAGKKHERPILLEDWQQPWSSEAPWAFLRGFIRSDGCAFVNRTGPLRVPQLRLREPLGRHPGSRRVHLPRPACSPRRYAHAIRLNRRVDVGTHARARRSQILTPRIARLVPLRLWRN